MQHVSLRKIDSNDLYSLQEIGIRTFSETFAKDNTQENLNHYLNKSFALDKLTEELHNSNCQFYFAEYNKEIIGYLKVNTGNAQTEIKQENALEIERIYVVKEFHGKKIGQLFFNKALEIARKKKVDYVWLGVWEHNHKALRFYEKNGFKVFDKHIFKVGNDEQTDFMMKLEMFV